MSQAKPIRFVITNVRALAPDLDEVGGMSRLGEASFYANVVGPFDREEMKQLFGKVFELRAVDSGISAEPGIPAASPTDLMFMIGEPVRMGRCLSVSNKDGKLHETRDGEVPRFVAKEHFDAGDIVRVVPGWRNLVERVRRQTAAATRTFKSAEPDRPNGTPGIQEGDLVYIDANGMARRAAKP